MAIVQLLAFAYPDPRKNAVLMAVISSAGFWLASILFLTIPYRIYRTNAKHKLK